SDTRTGIAAEASRLGLNFPVMHDRAQTVAQLYRAGKAGEVVCVDRETLGVFYRGAINDRAEGSSGIAGTSFLAAALESFLTHQPIAVRQTKPPGCEVPLVAATELNYSRDIAPILRAKCVTCHSPGNIGPWAMTNHAIVQAYSSSMLEEISTKEMPPWHADPEFGRFKNDSSLTIQEERQLIQWLMAGAPRGEGPDLLETIPPPPPKWPAELGEPDLVIRSPEQTIEASGVEPYRYIFVPTGLTQDKWLKAAIVRPSNPKVVHHYLVWEGASATQMAVGLAGYVPGTQRGAFPEGTGVLLHGNTPLTFNLHYTPDGENAVDQPELGLWFHKTPPAKMFITVPLVNQAFNIPAGAREHEVTAKLPIITALPYAGTLYGVSPHMHLRGTRMRFEVVYPDNRREVLLSVPHYEFHWQTGYQFAQPVKIPAGSKLFAIGAFDNSDLNLENPDASQNVKWGEQSFEEMFIGYCDFTQD
ncbi:MAG TPA: hypothetical protein VK633_02520, partial [Verrucomicrobiae bacterium]|nr:hypothetical protein [Verrucomicrobiae bacterium]